MDKCDATGGEGDRVHAIVNPIMTTTMNGRTPIIYAGSWRFTFSTQGILYEPFHPVENIETGRQRESTLPLVATCPPRDRWNSHGGEKMAVARPDGVKATYYSTDRDEVPKGQVLLFSEDNGASSF